MRLRPITWFVLSLMFFVAAAIVWHLSNEWQTRRNNNALPNQRERSVQPAKGGAPNNTNPAQTPRIALLSTPTLSSQKPAATNTSRFPFRLTNTAKNIDQLAQNGRSVLLRNALIDTETSTDLPIPAHLRAKGDPGSYVVQSRGPLDDAFRVLLRDAGAEIVSYIPKDAYLVRLSAAGAQQLASHPQTQVVLPFEPYYKLDETLLKLAVEEKSLPSETRLNVVLFPGERANAVDELTRLGVELVAEDRSPFGPVLTIRAPADSLVALANLPAVQGIEMHHSRKAANDLTRVRVGVSPDTTAATNNYLGLTGNGILVNVNDSGVDASNPDLAGRVLVETPATLSDPSGHGTHVVGTIISSGAHSPPGTNASGSVEGANFHGMAPAATAFVLPIDNLFGPIISDAYLQEKAAETNAFVSNNSWNYTGANAYNLAASSYDAAVRDALPGVTGSQPLLLVFSAGNAGFGNDDGLSGLPDSIESPATAKNVITVGAIEQLRNITNEVVFTNYDAEVPIVTTNQAFLGDTDSNDQVAQFSSRGNVGIGQEGLTGRFKPDVVAPGTFQVSTRPVGQNWDTAGYYNPTNNRINTFFNQVVQPGDLNNFSIFVPDNASQLRIEIVPNPDSPIPFPDLPIYVKQTEFPNTSDYDFVGTNRVSLPPDLALDPKGATWYYSVGNPTESPVSFDLRTILVTTFDNGDYFQVLSNLNYDLGPFYRYESGTSMSAPAVSGTLALMQQFFEQRLGRQNSPALMKALLINGARSAGTLYDFQINNFINYQGWGVANLSNSIPGALTNQAATTLPMKFYDQSPVEALATDQRKTRRLTTTAAARAQPLRVTLVWTDPPGNPAASIKLVNDLDLIVTNLDTGTVYYGNDFPSGSDFTQPADTNAPPNHDVVNNVENVYLPGSPDAPLGTNYSVTVVGYRVNVNAVTTQTNNVKQDYALVISSGDSEISEAFSVAENTSIVTTDNVFVTYVTNNGIPLSNQRVGANSALLGTTNGVTNQWNFYVFTNNTFTNVAFLTFLPPELSIPRMGTREFNLDNATRLQADIDLYVSTDPSLTNLNPDAVSAALKSRRRGGTENVVISNAPPNQIYYIGIKSEDQMASEYGFLGVSSFLPFSELDADGNLIVRGFTVPAEIPDGTPAKPGGVLVFGVAAESLSIRNAIVTNTITHESLGDLLGNLSHDNQFVVLNNHRGAPPAGLTSGPYTYVYDDTQSGALTGYTATDGPGSLRNFMGEDTVGVWLLTEVDNSLNQTGRVDNLTLKLQPHIEGTNDVVIAGRSFFYDFVDVPPEATNLTVTVISAAPLEVYLRRNAFPTRTDYDKSGFFLPPGGSLSIGLADSPPINAGRYYIGVFNPSFVPVAVRIITTVGLALTPASERIFTSTGVQPLLDDAVTVATQTITNDNRVSTAQIGLRIDHPRVSDLVLTLVSPGGTRVLLSENRGGSSPDGFGGVIYTTNYFPTTTSGGGIAAFTNILTPVPTSGILIVDYEFFTFADSLHAYYEGGLILDTGLINGSGQVSVNYGPGASTNITIIMNEGGNTNEGTVWNYTASVVSASTNYFTFTENTNLAPALIKFTPPPFGKDTNSASFALPETSLSVLAAEPTRGDWKLEILDNRATAVGKLLSWKLDLVFENTAPKATPLFHAVPVTETVTANSTNYFFVDVPIWASFATNSIINASGPVDLIFNQNGFPGMGVPLDFPLLAGVTNASVTLSTNSIPPLVSGQRYFLAVRNTGATSVSFTIEVEFDITTLTNAVPLTSDIAPILIPRYFQFDVSTNAAAVAFELYNLSGNAELVVRRGAPLPDLASFDYGSFNPGTNAEIITVFKDSFPVPLTAGRWYLGVFNLDAVNVNYTIRATEFTNSEPTVIRYQVISNSFCLTWTSIPTISYYVQGKINANDPVWNPVSPTIVATGLETTYCIPLPSPYQYFRVVRGLAPVIPDPNIVNTVPGNGIRYFYVDVPTWANFTTNSLLTANGPLNLLFNQNGLPTGTSLGDFTLLANVTSGGSTLATGGVPPLLPGQRYFLGVQNTNVTPVNFRLQVEFDITTLLDRVPVTSELPTGPIPRYFQFDVSTNALAVAFQILNPSGNVDLVVHQGSPLPTLSFFDYASFKLGTNNEAITVTTNSVPAPLVPGFWYLSVYNLDITNVTYTIRAAEFTNLEPVIVSVVTTSNDVCITWVSLPGANYLVQGKISTNDLTWTTISPTVSAVDIETTYCIPQPTPYQVFQVIEGALPPSFGSISVGTNGFVLQWTAGVNQQFQVQWTPTLAPPAWTTFTNIVTSGTGTFIFVDDGTQTGGLSGVRFYRLLEYP